MAVIFIDHVFINPAIYYIILYYIILYYIILYYIILYYIILYYIILIYIIYKGPTGKISSHVGDSTYTVLYGLGQTWLRKDLLIDSCRREDRAGSFKTMTGQIVRE